jgi:hypothetical protein
MIIRVAMALAGIAWTASAADLAIEQAKLTRDKPATLAVSLSAGTEAPTGFQFDLEFDPAALDLSVEAGPAAKQASKSAQSRMLQPGKLRVLIIGFNRNTIADGVLALIQVSYKGTDGGKTFPVHMTAASGTNADAKTVAVIARDGSVTVSK